MSTHFHPRPSTAPQSPARPGSSRLTIRAITPSPPPSEATSPSHPQSEIPCDASPGMTKQPSMRPRSEEISRARNHGLKREETRSAHELKRDYAGLQRGSRLPGRRSPVKRRGQSKNYRSRPYDSPTTLSSRCRTLSDQETDGADKKNDGIKQDEAKELESDDYSNTSTDYPDTPTPMTVSQKRSAYFPLGVTAPVVYPKHSSSARYDPDVVPTRAKSAASQGPDATPNAPGIKVQKPLADYTQRQTDLDAYHSYIRQTNNPNETTKAKAPQPHAETLHLAYNPSPQTITPQTDDIQQATSHPRFCVPIPTQVTSSTVPRKPIASPSSPSASRAHHLASRSAASNISVGTAQSQRSVFSTPGRDEMERKKALVEVDEGPFGRVASVAELNESRRVVSGGVRRERGAGGDVGSSGSSSKGGKKDGGCGLRGRCCVM